MTFEKYSSFLNMKPERWDEAARALAEYLLGLNSENLNDLLEYLRSAVP